ncbi:MAG: hypothetical protein ABIP34_23405, partial [Rhodoferax sp.]
PHTFNFAEAAELAEAAGAARRVAGMPHAVRVALQMASHPDVQAKAAASGLAFAARNQGATARTLAALQAYLQARANPSAQSESHLPPHPVVKPHNLTDTP